MTAQKVVVEAIDMTNLAQHVAEALNPPGTIVAFGGTNFPSGWILCDGRSISRSSYARLYDAIGTNWGTSDALSFRVPDLRGLFLRGVDNSPLTGESGRDPERGIRQSLYPGGSSSNNIGSFQFDAFATHRHRSQKFDNNKYLVDSFGTGPVANSNYNVDETGGSNPIVETDESGGAETRPKNVYVNYMIKY